MIRHLIALGIVVVATIIGLNVYLQPNDLSNCDTKPGSVIGCQSVGAIVAISGGNTNSRADEAINLYKNGWSDKLIFSGAAEDKTGPSNASVMKTRAIEAGVPDSAIYIDEYAETTKQNAQNTNAILIKLDIKSIILVTSGYHQRRANLEFGKSVKNVTILNHSAQNDKDWSNYWWMTPRGWWLAASELVRIAAFYMTGIWS